MLWLIVMLCCVMAGLDVGGVSWCLFGDCVALWWLLVLVCLIDCGYVGYSWRFGGSRFACCVGLVGLCACVCCL